MVEINLAIGNEVNQSVSVYITEIFGSLGFGLGCINTSHGGQVHESHSYLTASGIGRTLYRRETGNSRNLNSLAISDCIIDL